MGRRLTAVRAYLRGACVAVAAAGALTSCTGEAGRTFTGYVEGDLLYIGPEEAGRLVELDAREGAMLAAGAVVARLDDRVQAADLAAASGALAEATARLEKARAAQQRPEEVAVLQATERRLMIALDLSRIDLDRQKSLVPKGAASQAALDTAQHLYDQNQASLDEVRRQIDVGRITARSEDIAAAEASVRQAQASRDAAQVRLDRRTLKVPADARVQTLYFRVGELVPEGKPVASLLPPQLIKVRFFVPQTELQSLAPGGTVEVTCDGCRPATARISFISDVAEFTPPVIYSREERAKLVYLVEALPDDPGLARPGQPVTVRLASGR